MVSCPYDSLQLSESQWNHYIWEACSANWWDALTPAAPCTQQWSTGRAQFFSTTTRDCTSHNQHAKSWTDWATKVCPTRHIHLTSCQSTTTSSSISTTSAGKTLPQPAGGRKCFQEFIKSQSRDFYTKGINKLISHWQKCVDCNGSYFD